MEKILIVDDNEYLRYTLTEVLQDAGYSSFAVENGDKAIEGPSRGSYPGDDPKDPSSRTRLSSRWRKVLVGHRSAARARRARTIGERQCSLQIDISAA